VQVKNARGSESASHRKGVPCIGVSSSGCVRGPVRNLTAFSRRLQSVASSRTHEKWTDVDFDAGTVLVKRTLSRIGIDKEKYSNGWKLTPPKTKKSRRTIPLPEIATT
jgi:hypothetical protein